MKRLPSGKPIFDGEGTDYLNLSITHDDDYCLCVIGPGNQGCDLEPIIFTFEIGMDRIVGPNSIKFIGRTAAV